LLGSCALRRTLQFRQLLRDGPRLGIAFSRKTLPECALFLALSRQLQSLDPLRLGVRRA